MFNDNLDMLPDHDVVVPKTEHALAFLADLKKDPIRWRAHAVYGWIACFATGERVLDLRVLPAGAVCDGRRVDDPRQQSGDDGAVLLRRRVGLGRAAADAEDRPSRHRDRRASLSCWCHCWSPPSRSTPTTTSCCRFAAAAMLWGHYWDASNCMTIPTMVAQPKYRGTASGFAYMFVKLPSFLAIFLFPTLFAAIGQANATLFVAIFPVIGLLAAIFILPEVYGCENDCTPYARLSDRGGERRDQGAGASPAGRA